MTEAGEQLSVEETLFVELIEEWKRSSCKSADEKEGDAVLNRFADEHGRLTLMKMGALCMDKAVALQDQHALSFTEKIGARIQRLIGLPRSPTPFHKRPEYGRFREYLAMAGNIASLAKPSDGEDEGDPLWISGGTGKEIRGILGYYTRGDDGTRQLKSAGMRIWKHARQEGRRNFHAEAV